MRLTIADHLRSVEAAGCAIMTWMAVEPDCSRYILRIARLFRAHRKIWRRAEQICASVGIVARSEAPFLGTVMTDHAACSCDKAASVVTCYRYDGSLWLGGRAERPHRRRHTCVGGSTWRPPLLYIYLRRGQPAEQQCPRLLIAFLFASGSRDDGWCIRRGGRRPPLLRRSEW